MSKNLIPAQRRERIQAFLAKNKIVATSDLCNLLSVSEATVRRDLERLEEEGILERTHGGAVLSQRIQLEPEYLQRAQRHPEEKRLIGMQAASQIEKGDIAHSLVSAIAVGAAMSVKEMVLYDAQKNLIDQLFQCENHMFTPRNKKIIETIDLDYINSKFK